MFTERDTTSEIVTEIKSRLLGEGYSIAGEQPLQQGGVQLKTHQGPVVNTFATGTIQVQGKDNEPVKALVADLTRVPKVSPNVRPETATDVFVVYGHDAAAKTATEAMVRRWGLNPILLDQIPAAGLTLVEKLEEHASKARFAIVLATADDVVLISEEEKEFRARQNVILELGMVLAMLGRANVAILLQNRVGMKKPTDIDGLEYLPFKNDVAEAKLGLAKMLAGAGYPIDIQQV